MNNNTQLSRLEAERERLQKECSQLFDQKQAIDLQLKENQERLTWLDNKIDGMESSTSTNNDIGKRKFALTMTNDTQTQDCSMDDNDNNKVKFEVVDDKKKKAKKSVLPQFTQPEEYLTDPHTQQNQQQSSYLTDPIQENDEEEVEFEGVSKNNSAAAAASSSAELRRISKSPQLAASSASQTMNNTGGAKQNNPFQDLWNPSQDMNDTTMSSSNNNNNGARKGTLEKYFMSNTSSSGAAAAQSRANNNNNNNNAGRQQLQLNNNNQGDHQAPSCTKHRWTDRMKYHLRHTFNIAQFRGHQESIINATMKGLDTFVVMRTGGGKSLCYQLPAVLELETRPRMISIVISPLVSLIRDQEEQMNEMHPGSAVSFFSGMAGGTSEHARRWNLVRDAQGGVGLIFVTPEKVINSGKFKGELEKLNNQGRLSRFVIDECHWKVRACVVLSCAYVCSIACQWGHDFRPDYTKLNILKHHFPKIPILAVTATASDRVRNDVCDNILNLSKNYQFFRSSANRENLNYSVRVKSDGKDAVVKDMVAFIQENHVGEAGIVYTFSKKEADAVADSLTSNGIVARSYHSDVPQTRKDQIQRSWMRNNTQVVVATIAFGLGINKHDCRFVLHHSLSKSLESYYQESGRAGRDGRPANCVLWYSPKDVPRMLGMIHGEAGEGSFWSMAKYGQAHGDDAVCRNTILATLGEADDTMGMRLLNAKNNCKTTVSRELGAHCQTLVRLIDVLNTSGEDCTINQIVSKWRSKAVDDNLSFLKDNPPAKDLNKEECERVIISLLVSDILHPNIRYTAYSTIVYLVLGPQGRKLLASSNPRISIDLPVRSKAAKKTTASSKKSPLAVADEDGWISPQSKAKSTKKTAGKTKAKSKKKSKTRKTRKVSKRKSAVSKPAIDIVEIGSSSSESSSEEEELVVVSKKRAANSNKGKKVLDDTSEDSDSEFELSE